MQSFSTRLPVVYSLEHRREIFLPNRQHLELYVESLADALNFLVKQLGFRKLTVLAIGEGAQIVLKYLSVASLRFFEVLDKVVLLNCEYGGFRMLHAHSQIEYQQMIKEMTEPARLEVLNRLRIVSVQGRKFNRLSGLSNYQLVLQSEEGKLFSLKNFVPLESRHLWNVYLDLTNQQQLEFEPMVRLLAEFFVLDSSSTMPVKSIDYFFRFREDPNPQPQSTYKQEFTLQCPEIILELNKQLDYIEDRRCKHVRFRNDQLNYSLVVEGQHGLELFTEKYLQIPPLSNTSKLVYLLQSTQSLAGIYILNRNKQHYLISVVKLYQYTEIEVESTSIQRVITNSRLVRFPPDVATKVCPQKPLVFPLAGTKCFNLRNGLMIQGARSNSLIFFDLENPYFERYWHLHKNLILASLFALYIEKEDMFTVLLYQLLLNGIALWRYNVLFICLVTVYTLSVATIIIKIVGLSYSLVSYLPHLDKDKELLIVISPMLLLLKRGFYFELQVNEWYALLLGMGVVFGKPASILCWILIYLNFDYVTRQEQYLLRFLLVQVSMLAVTLIKRFQSSRTKRIIDLALVTMLHLFAEEELWLIQQLFEVYAIAVSLGIALDYLNHQGHLRHHHILDS